MDTVPIKLYSDQQRLAEAARRLVAALDPERIYFYGSRARCDHRPESDYDLMVIVPDDSPQVPDPTTIAFKAVSGLFPFGCDVKVRRHTYFYKQTHLKASMPTAVLQDGKLLYAKDGEEGCEGIVSTEPIVSEGMPPHFDLVRVENTREWFMKARKDLLCADRDLGGSDEFLEDVMFHSQQAVEKSIKAFLTWHDFPFQRTHDLEELAENCRTLDPDLATQALSLEWLSKWSYAGRYPGEPAPTRSYAEDACRAASAFYERVRNSLPEETWS